jgi:hypothetical protein
MHSELCQFCIPVFVGASKSRHTAAGKFAKLVMLRVPNDNMLGPSKLSGNVVCQKKMLLRQFP